MLCMVTSFKPIHYLDSLPQYGENCVPEIKQSKSSVFFFLFPTSLTEHLTTFQRKSFLLTSDIDRSVSGGHGSSSNSLPHAGCVKSS